MNKNIVEMDKYLTTKVERVLRASAGISVENATGNEMKIALYAAEKEIEHEDREASYRAHAEANSCFL